MSLKNRVALVTGSARGLGKAIAERLAKNGASVVISDIDKAASEQTAADLRDAGFDAMALRLNVADEENVNEAIAQIEKEKGAVSILVNNAGILKDTPVLETSISDWQRSLDIMLTGSLLCARAVAPGMIEQKWGRIINLGSMMSATAFGNDFAYCTAKSGMLGLTRSLAMEFGPHNICVNTVCPGNIDTAMLRDVADLVEKRDGLEPGQFLKQQTDAIPLRRLGVPEDVAKLTSYLCSADADYMTGQSLHINGGLYLT